MLSYLALLTHTDQFAFFRLFGYLTFRSGAAVITALVIAFWLNPVLIRWLKVRQGKGQPIRSDGPQRHIIEKAGTPTMGGLLILIPWVLSTLLWASLSNRYVWVVLMVTLAFGLLGFLDDYYKVTKRTADGLSGKTRLAIEFAILKVPQDVFGAIPDVTEVQRMAWGEKLFPNLLIFSFLKIIGDGIADHDQVELFLPDGGDFFLVTVRIVCDRHGGRIGNGGRRFGFGQQECFQ